jgi:hypothetical protein
MLGCRTRCKQQIYPLHLALVLGDTPHVPILSYSKKDMQRHLNM